MSNPHWHPSWLPADLILATTGHLALFLGGSDDSFTGDLLHLIAKDDPGNRAKLISSFPREVLAWNIWSALESDGHAPTAGQLAAIVDVGLADVDAVLIAGGHGKMIAELNRLTGKSPAADQVPDVAGRAAGQDGEPGQGVPEPLQ